MAAAAAQSSRRETLLGREYLLIEKLGSNDHAFSLWDAGLGFCRYLEKNPSVLAQFRGARVLELGSGTGLVAMFLAAHGAHTIASDLPHVIPHLSSCVSANGFALREPPTSAAGSDGTIMCAGYRWGDPVEPIVSKFGPFSFVIGTDVVYDNDLVRPLLRSAALFALYDGTAVQSTGSSSSSSSSGATAGSDDERSAATTTSENALTGVAPRKAAVVYFANEQRDSITHALFKSVADSLFSVKEVSRSRLALESRDSPLHVYSMRLRRGMTRDSVCAPLDLDARTSTADNDVVTRLAR